MRIEQTSYLDWLHLGKASNFAEKMETFDHDLPDFFLRRNEMLSGNPGTRR